MNARSLILFALIFLFAGDALAQADAPLFDYQVQARIQTDTGAPALILKAREFIESGTVKMERSDGKTTTARIGKMKPGQEKRIALKQPKGAFRWNITVKGKSKFDQTTEQTIETETAWLDPIQLSVDPNKVQIGEGKLYLRTNVPLTKVEIEVIDTDGAKFVDKTQTFDNAKGELPITWSSSGDEVGAIRLTAHDIAGFWSAVVLEPFWVDIPHDEVVFDFGKATWQESETPKLEETLQAVREAMAAHAKKGLQMKLYIVGYTDTVGSAADNQKLSTARARAIAQWFRKSGLKIPIMYQGFGEKVLAVPTPDNTPEPKNRRALYILGNAPPPTSGQIPRSNWKGL